MRGDARRRFVAALGGLYLAPRGAAAPAWAQAPSGPAPALSPIEQPPKADRDQFMQRAFDLRRAAEQRGEAPYGAVVVKDRQIVGEGMSEVTVLNDPTAHAEVQAIRDACRRLGVRNLAGGELYATLRPCPMCETASHWAGIRRILHSRPIVDAGGPRYGGC